MSFEWAKVDEPFVCLLFHCVAFKITRFSFMYDTCIDSTNFASDHVNETRPKEEIAGPKALYMTREE